MKQLKFVFSLLSLLTLGSGCISHSKRNTASAAPPEYQDTTMVNVISAKRMPAALGTIEISTTDADVSVSTQVMKAPGEKIQHGLMMFSVKNHPEVAGQIMGNTGGSTVSVKFTEVVKKITTSGLNTKATAAITTAQNKFKNIVNLGAEQRTEAIKTVLLETREELLTAY